MRLVNDDPCPNCGRTDGAPSCVAIGKPENGYMPGSIAYYFACSHCVDALWAQTTDEYPPRSNVATIPQTRGGE